MPDYGEVMTKFLVVFVVFFFGMFAALPGWALSGRERTYYGEEFDRLIRQDSDSGAIVSVLKKVLRNYHRPQPGAFDEIVERCDERQCFKHNAIGYNTARKVLLGDIHLKQTPDGAYAIADVYCVRDYVNADFPSGQGPGPGRIPANNVLNVEHTWPQSRFNGGFSKTEQKSDLHHLYPSDSQLNSTRGNFEFGEVENDIRDLKCRTSRFGRVDGGSNPVFEPPEEHKGRVARALFYFSIRYDLKISQQEETFLRQWHEDHPVTEDERVRNERVFELQSSRNPFVDHPSTVAKITDF